MFQLLCSECCHHAILLKARGAIKMIKVEQRVIDLHVMMIAIFYQNANFLMNLLKYIIEK